MRRGHDGNTLAVSSAESTTLPAIALPGPDARAVARQPRLEFAANLDILRSVAVSLVLLDHVLETISAAHPARQFHPYDWCAGRLGVLMFFVHTSLVLNFSMARLRAGGLNLLRSFLLRRAFRLYPLSILCVLLVVTLRVPDMPFHPEFVWHGWANLVSNLALTMNLTFSLPVLGPLWSLPIEAQMYVALPLIYILLGPTRSPWVAGALWLVSCGLAWIQPHYSDRLNVIGYAPCFMSGVLAYTLSGRCGTRVAAMLWGPFLGIALLGFALTQKFVVAGVYNRPLGWLFCLALGLAIPLFRDSGARTANFMAAHLARYSYGIYLFHCIALWLGYAVLARWPESVQWTVAGAVVLFMSVASYHWLEKPAIDLGARLARKWA
jgi:peptidoglycan/LPS O-acetylase OafA/YrhL